MIKFVFFVCVILVVSCKIQKSLVNLPPEVQAIVLEAFNKCCVNKEQMLEIIRIVRDGECKDDQEFKTAIHCIWKESGYIKKDGRLLIDKAAKAFPGKEEEMKKIWNDCDKDMGHNPVENVYKTFKCFQETSKYGIQILPQK